jgi:hypothetical protein
MRALKQKAHHGCQQQHLSSWQHDEWRRGGRREEREREELIIDVCHDVATKLPVGACGKVRTRSARPRIHYLYLYPPGMHSCAHSSALSMAPARMQHSASACSSSHAARACSSSQAARPCTPRMGHCHSSRVPLRAASSSQQQAVPSTDREALKRELRLTLTFLNSPGSSGRPQSELKQKLLCLVDALVLLSPVQDTATSDLINGRWALLYTASGARGAAGSSIAGGGPGLASALPFVQAVSDSAYQFFYRFVPILAGSAVGEKASSTGPLKARGNFQVCHSNEGPNPRARNSQPSTQPLLASATPPHAATAFHSPLSLLSSAKQHRSLTLPGVMCSIRRDSRHSGAPARSTWAGRWNLSGQSGPRPFSTRER